jgi:hypothetical protein
MLGEPRSSHEDLAMKLTAMLVLVLACCTGMVQAQTPSLDVAHSLAPYPPSCITLLPRQSELYGDNAVRFWSGQVSLELLHQHNGVSRGPVKLDMYRVPCAEPDRSIIVAEFSLLPGSVDPEKSRFVLPVLVAEIGGWHHVAFALQPEPHNWGQGAPQHALTRRVIGEWTGGWEDPRNFRWRYVLDLGPGGVFWDTRDVVDQYNRSFRLYSDPPGAPGAWFIDVPSTQQLLDRNPELPLNGRLSGAWADPGAADQGFVLSFSNPVAPAGSNTPVQEDPELLVFLTWYTFDHEGRPLWLAGAARFTPGASEVSVPVVKVAQGQFLDASIQSDPGATFVGEVRLKARHCNALDVDYDLAALNLGRGGFQLQRLFALETAGYPCRDYYARRASLEHAGAQP